MAINTHLGKNIEGGWIIYRDSDNTFQTVLTNDADASALNTSDTVFSMEFYTPGGVTPKLTLTEANGDITNDDNGTIEYDLTGANIETLPRDRYLFVIKYSISGDDTKPLAQGYTNITRELNPGTTTTSVNMPVNVNGVIVKMAVTIPGGTSDELTSIANLVPSNDDIIQRKAGAWINRTLAQLKSDLQINLFQTNIDVFVCTGSSGRYTWSNQPSAITALFGSGMEGPSTRIFDTTNYNYIKLVAQVFALSASANTPKIYLQYSEDNVTYTTVGSGTGSDVISLATTGHTETGWIATPFNGNGYWRVVGSGGDGAADPQFGYVSIRFKQ